MTRKTKSYCSVPQCFNHVTESISLHRFPRDVELAKKWQNAMKIGKPIGKYMAVCSAHFLPEDYNQFITNKRRKHLKKTAIPTQKVPICNCQSTLKTSPNNCNMEHIEIIPETSNATPSINTPLFDPLETPLNVHYKCAEEIPNYECNNCHYTTPWKVSLLNHLYKECENRQTMLQLKNWKMSLKKHLRNHVSADDSIFKCHLCSYKSVSLVGLKHHQLKLCGEFTHVKECTSKRRKKEYKCQYCSYQTNVKARLESHMIYKHTPEEEIDWFKCDQCSYKGKTAHCLQQHKTKHETHPRYECHFCTFKTMTNTILKRHILVKHTPKDKITWFYCDQCDYKTEIVYRLKTHALTHQLKDRVRFKCPHCSHTVLRKRNLKTHLKNKHNINEVT